MSSIRNGLTHPDSSGQLPHGTPVITPHANPPHIGVPAHPAIPHPITGGLGNLIHGLGHTAPPAGHPGSGIGGARGPPKNKPPRAGGFTHPGTGFGFGHVRGFHGGLLDNRFILDRERHGFGRFRAELSAIERERFLASLRGCVGCNFRLLQFIFGLQYFPEFANLCTPQPTGCGVWILGVNGCWFRVGSAEQAFVNQLGLGGPRPVVIPCGGGFPVGFGHLRRPGFGFPVGHGIHPGGHLEHGFEHGRGQHGGGHFPGLGGGGFPSDHGGQPPGSGQPPSGTGQGHPPPGQGGPPMGAGGGFHPGDTGNDGTGASGGQ